MAGSDYYDHTTYPSQGAVGSSSAARAEFELIEAGFGKLPALTGNGGKLLAVNAGETAQEALTAAQALAAIGAQATSGKDASGGYAGLTLFKLNLKNAAGTITSWFTTAATAARTWTMPDKDGTVAMTSDFAAPGPIGGTTPAAGSFTTLTASGDTLLGGAAQAGSSRLTLKQGVDSSIGGLGISSVDGNAAVISRLNSGVLVIRNSGADVVAVSSAGLAVTGALSATTEASIQSSTGYGASADKSLVIGGTDNGFVDAGSTSHWRHLVSGNASGQSYKLQGFVRGTGYTDRVIVASAGNLLVGATGRVDSEIATFRKDASNFAFAVQNEHTTGQTYRSKLALAAATTSAYHFVGTSGVIAGGTDVVFIYGNGNIVNTNNSYGPLSDVKLKENITDASPKLAHLMRVRIVNYNLKASLGYTPVKQIGVIAQELETVFPGLVDSSPDYIQVTKTREVAVPEVPAVDAVLNTDGVEITPAVAAVPATKRTEEYTEREATGEVTKSVKMSVFVPMLIKAMQEQQAMIVDLQTRLTALEVA